MFKRRKPHSNLQLLKEVFWPTMGWIRAFRYMRLRIVRLSDTTHKIAAGLAIGVSVSFSPLLMTHFIQAAIVAWIIRANIPASLIATFIGNPWTFPFMWWAAISLGSTLFAAFGLDAAHSLPDNIDLATFWGLVKSEPLRVFLPWMLGGYLIAFLSWPVSYFVFYHLVKGAKAARTRAKLHKVHQVAGEITGQKE